MAEHTPVYGTDTGAHKNVETVHVPIFAEPPKRRNYRKIAVILIAILGSFALVMQVVSSKSNALARAEEYAHELMSSDEPFTADAIAENDDDEDEQVPSFKANEDDDEEEDSDYQE